VFFVLFWGFFGGGGGAFVCVFFLRLALCVPYVVSCSGCPFLIGPSVVFKCSCSTILQLYHGDKFLWVEETIVPVGTIELTLVNDNLNHIWLYRVRLVLNENRTQNCSNDRR
jgi:hypothetical protein